MNLLQAIILGIIQGLTEFIPVSSTAHLLLTEHLLGWQIPDREAFIFDVLVQLGTLVSLLIYFRREIGEISVAVLRGLAQRRPFEEPPARLGWLVVLATLPALAAGIVFKPVVEFLFSNPDIEAAIRLGLSAVLLFSAERLSRQSRQLGDLTWKDALWIGAAQVLAVVPGASRSGTTISGGMFRHLERPAAARFSFLMSIPIMLAAGAAAALDLVSIPGFTQSLPTIIPGFIAAAVVGYAAIHWLLGFLSRRRLTVFAAYCAVMAVVALVSAILTRAG